MKGVYLARYCQMLDLGGIVVDCGLWTVGCGLWAVDCFVNMLATVILFIPKFKWEVSCSACVLCAAIGRASGRGNGIRALPSITTAAWGHPVLTRGQWPRGAPPHDNSRMDTQKCTKKCLKYVLAALDCRIFLSLEVHCALKMMMEFSKWFLNINNKIEVKEGLAAFKETAVGHN